MTAPSRDHGDDALNALQRDLDALKVERAAQASARSPSHVALRVRVPPSCVEAVSLIVDRLGGETRGDDAPLASMVLRNVVASNGDAYARDALDRIDRGDNATIALLDALAKAAHDRHSPPPPVDAEALKAAATALHYALSGREGYVSTGAGADSLTVYVRGREHIGVAPLRHEGFRVFVEVIGAVVA